MVRAVLVPILWLHLDKRSCGKGVGVMWMRPSRLSARGRRIGEELTGYHPLRLLSSKYRPLKSGILLVQHDSLPEHALLMSAFPRILNIATNGNLSSIKQNWPSISLHPPPTRSAFYTPTQRLQHLSVLPHRLNPFHLGVAMLAFDLF
jgi:hypothetical protein